MTITPFGRDVLPRRELEEREVARRIDVDSSGAGRRPRELVHRQQSPERLDARASDRLDERRVAVVVRSSFAPEARAMCATVSW